MRMEYKSSQVWRNDLMIELNCILFIQYSQQNNQHNQNLVGTYSKKDCKHVHSKQHH